MDKIYDGALRDKYDRASEKPLVVNSIGLHKDGRLTVVREKGRLDYHLIYVKEGQLYVEYEGGEYILEKGGFVIYTPGQRQYYSGRPECERYWIHFTGTQTEQMLSEWGFTGGIYEADENRTVYDIFGEIIEQYIIPSEKSEIKISVLLQTLFMRLYESVNSKEYINPAVSGLVKYVNNNCRENIDVKKYADNAGMSEESYCHLFRKSIGVPLHKSITQVRLKEARRLLKYSSESISQIAYSVGYDDPLYFSRIFKKYYGVPPKFIRNSQG